MMYVVVDSIVWAFRMLGIKTVLQDFAVSSENPLLTIGSGLFVLPLGTMAAAMFLPPVMLVAYPAAVMVAQRVRDRRRVAGIGAVLGAVLAPVILAAGWYLDEIPAYRTSFVQVYGESLAVTLLPSIVAGAAIGWIVARLQRRSPISAGTSA